MLSRLLDIFFPRHSLTGTEGGWITASERRSMRTFPVRLHKEILRKRDLKNLDCLIAAGSYSESPLLRKAIHSFKYLRIKDLGKELADKIASALPGLLTLPDKFNPKLNSQLPAPPKSATADEGGSIINSLLTEALAKAGQLRPVLCPVPLHWTRKFHRGFNQAEVIAQSLSAKTGWPVIQLLKRSKPTGHQAFRTRTERFEAMQDVFVSIAKSQTPLCVLLIDDVFTTGATMDSCAKALKRAGVKFVAGLVAAHG